MNFEQKNLEQEDVKKMTQRDIFNLAKLELEKRTSGKKMEEEQEAFELGKILNDPEFYKSIGVEMPKNPHGLKIAA